jgi:hypothetical protein
MARLPPVEIPRITYHVTHRGNRRQDVFLQFRQIPGTPYLILDREHAVAVGILVWQGSGEW